MDPVTVDESKSRMLPSNTSSTTVARVQPGGPVRDQRPHPLRGGTNERARLYDPVYPWYRWILGPVALTTVDASPPGIGRQHIAIFGDIHQTDAVHGCDSSRRTARIDEFLVSLAASRQSNGQSTTILLELYNEIPVWDQGYLFGFTSETFLPFLSGKLVVDGVTVKNVDVRALVFHQRRTVYKSYVTIIQRLTQLSHSASLLDRDLDEIQRRLSLLVRALDTFRTNTTYIHELTAITGISTVLKTIPDRRFVTAITKWIQTESQSRVVMIDQVIRKWSVQFKSSRFRVTDAVRQQFVRAFQFARDEWSGIWLDAYVAAILRSPHPFGPSSKPITFAVLYVGDTHRIRLLDLFGVGPNPPFRRTVTPDVVLTYSVEHWDDQCIDLNGVSSLSRVAFGILPGLPIARWSMDPGYDPLDPTEIRLQDQVIATHDSDTTILRSLEGNNPWTSSLTSEPSTTVALLRYIRAEVARAPIPYFMQCEIRQYLRYHLDADWADLETNLLTQFSKRDINQYRVMLETYVQDYQRPYQTSRLVRALWAAQLIDSLQQLSPSSVPSILPDVSSDGFALDIIFRDYFVIPILNSVSDIIATVASRFRKQMELGRLSSNDMVSAIQRILFELDRDPVQFRVEFEIRRLLRSGTPERWSEIQPLLSRALQHTEFDNGTARAYFRSYRRQLNTFLSS